MMIGIRICKLLLVIAVAFFFTLVVFNNTTDFDSNYQFVRHVLMMDSTFPGNRGMWRALHAPWIHLSFYLGIIGWEILNAVLGWWGSVVLFRALRKPEEEFQRAKQVAVAALTAGMLQWFVGFLCIGAEWFLMWQSKLWNGQDAAFRIFAVEGLVLVILLLPDRVTSSSGGDRHL
jgi:predicted small integral membrane protein